MRTLSPDRHPVDAVVTAGAAPLREQVVATLTDQILNHQLRPGQRLVERELVEQLSVSRTTVREAIRELASEGLVDVLPQRGATVASASPEDARALYEARGALESLVVERFVANASLPQRDRLTVAAFELGEIAESSDATADIMAARDRLYAALFDGSGSPVLQQLVESVQTRVRVLCASSLSEEGRSVTAAAELRGVVAAIRRGDSDHAAALMREHVRLASAATLRTLLVA